MNTLREILKDKFINAFIVALVFGIGTIDFINNAGGMVLDHVFGVATTTWNWKIFYGQLVLYGMTIIAAVFLRRRSGVLK
jgi:NADP-dependent 3-hydroxy acid dehydrogenase YdfG